MQQTVWDYLATARQAAAAGSMQQMALPGNGARLVTDAGAATGGEMAMLAWSGVDTEKRAACAGADASAAAGLGNPSWQTFTACKAACSVHNNHQATQQSLSCKQSIVRYALAIDVED